MGDPDRAANRTEHLHGEVVGVTQVGGRLVATRQELEVVDRATGRGPSILARLCLTADALGALDRPGGEPVELEPLVATIEPGVPDDGLVEGLRLSLAGTISGLHVTHRTVAEQLLAHLTHRHLDRLTPEVRLHGGAVADTDGRAVLVLAPSGSGKSTLVAHLVHGGLDLINDEQVSVFGDLGLVGGFTRPVGIKEGGVHHLPAAVRSALDADADTTLVTAAELGGRHRLWGRPVLVVLPRRVPGASTGWEQLEPVEAVEALCANNLDLVRKPVAGLEAFADLATSVPVVRVTYPDTAAGATAVRSLLEHPPPLAAPRWSVAVDGGPVGAGGTDTGGARPAGGTVRVTIGHEVVLFSPVTRAVARLNPAGALVWDQVVRGLPRAPGAGPLLARLSELGLVEGLEATPKGGVLGRLRAWLPHRT